MTDLVEAPGPAGRPSVIRPKRVDGLEIREVDDGFVVSHAPDVRAHRLNHTAMIVLELCDGRQSTAEIAAHVGAIFGLESPPVHEVRAALATMTDEGLVVASRYPQGARHMPLAEKLRHFPHFLWINLDRETSRRAYMEEQLRVYAFPRTRLSGYDGSTEDVTGHLTHPGNECGLSKAELGATISHLKAVKHFLDEVDGEYAVVAEDDLDLSMCRFWDFDWDYVVAHLPYDWDVVQLSITTWPTHMRTNIHQRLPHDWSATGYLISRHHAQKIARLHCRDGKYKIDNGVSTLPLADEIVYHSGKTYSIPLFLTKLGFDSAIHPEDVEKVHVPSWKAYYTWWSEESAHVDQETLFQL